MADTESQLKTNPLLLDDLKCIQTLIESFNEAHSVMAIDDTEVYDTNGESLGTIKYLGSVEGYVFYPAMPEMRF